MKKKIDHDPKTCFRCRLHKLYTEVGDKYGNEPGFMLMSLAEAAGSMLSQQDESEFMQFLFAVHKYAMEDIEYTPETRH
jgi:hypothetical protein